MDPMTKTPLTPTACKGCGKPIYFCRDEDGKTQVLDSRPPVFVQIRDSDAGAPQVMRVDGFVSHFATCPQANRFSQSQAKAAAGGTT